MRALDRDRALNAGFDRVGRAITAGEQMARAALRHRRDLRRSVLALAAYRREWLDQVLDFIAEDVAALGCDARNRAPRRASSTEGTSADRQIDIFTQAPEPPAGNG